jgi:flagellar biosynthetic protein FlhB
MAIIMRSEFRLPREAMFDPNAPLAHLNHTLSNAFFAITPFLALLVVAAALAPLALGGFAFSTEAWAPKLERLDPLKGLGKMFAVRSLVELIKSILKVLLVFMVAWVLFKRDFDAMLRLGDQEVSAALLRSGDLIVNGFVILCASLALVAALDVPYQLWDYKRGLKMTRQEIRDEMKETDGRPEVKGRIRRLQMEMAQRRMMEEVPRADVVVTNPTHFAVALRYDHGKEGAPVVVAKGADLIAARIRQLAVASAVPLVSAPPLARALFRSTKLGEQIPDSLYLAVAQVLAYVYQLKAGRPLGQPAPEPPRDLPVPDDLVGPVP